MDITTLKGERYNPGVSDVTPQEAVKQEIIHQLCLKSMPHSGLIKTIRDDPYKETGIDGVVQEVANFK